MATTEITNEMVSLNLDDIYLDPNDNSRVPDESDPELKTLAESIKANGQIQPVVVAPGDGVDGKFRLVLGFRRYAAVQSLNKGKGQGQPVQLRAQIMEVEPSEKGRLQAFRTNVQENLRRKSYTPVDLLQVVQKLKSDFKMTYRQIAKELGKSPAWVTSTLKLADLNENILQRVHAGELSVDAALALVGRPVEEALGIVAEAEGKTQEAVASGKARKGRKGPTARSVKKAAKASQPAKPSKSKTPQTRSVPSMKEFREILEENCGPVVSGAMRHVLTFLIELSWGRADEKDFEKVSKDVDKLVANPMARTGWSTQVQEQEQAPKRKTSKRQAASVRKSKAAKTAKAGQGRTKR